jgi:hypothetical protein
MSLTKLSQGEPYRGEGHPNIIVLTDRLDDNVVFAILPDGVGEEDLGPGPHGVGRSHVHASGVQAPRYICTSTSFILRSK